MSPLSRFYDLELLSLKGFVLGFTIIMLLIVAVVMCTLRFSMVTAVDTTPWCLSATTPRRGGLRFGTARQFRAEQAVPRGRSKIFKAVNGGGVNTLGAPAVAKQTRPITRSRDSLQVEEEPVVSAL